MNSISIAGRITADPELAKAKDKDVLNFTLAVKRPYTTEITDFINCVAWGQRARFLGSYAHKGDIIGVTGYLTVEDYEKDGQKRKSYKVTCSEVEILGHKKSTEEQTGGGPQFYDIPEGENEKLPF